MTRVGLRDLLVLAVLLLVCAMPVWPELTGGDLRTLPLDAHIRVGWEVFNQRALQAGEIPLWNPYQFGGRPHLANPETLALYPPHVLLRALPTALIFPVSFALHAWIAGVGSYAAARQLALTRPVALALSLAVLFSSLLEPGPAVAYAPHAYAIAWLPVIAALVIRAARRPDVLPHAALVAATALAVMGSPRGAFYASATLVAAYALVRLTAPATAPRSVLLVQAILLAALAGGLTAFQTFPAARLFAASASAAGGLVADIPADESWHGRGDAGRAPESALAEALRSLDGRGRVLSACQEALNGVHLITMPLAGAAGYGGVFPGDYARFANAARGPAVAMSPLFQGIPEAGRSPARDDLLPFLGVEYLVTCGPADPGRWELLAERDGAALYRMRSPWPRAFWTCMPRSVGRSEFEYRVRRGRYDASGRLRGNPVIHVRWAPELDEPGRREAEARLRIWRERDLGDRTWQYELLDGSSENINAILTSPLVEDTHGLDRAARTLAALEPEFREEKTERLVGADPCEPLRPAKVLAVDRFDGRMSVAIDAPGDGVVFFSETYYSDRLAYVDGRRVDALKTNLAFTAVPVAGGVHRVELRYDDRPFQAGVGLSLLTLVGWPAAAWWTRRRSRTQALATHTPADRARTP